MIPVSLIILVLIVYPIVWYVLPFCVDKTKQRSVNYIQLAMDLTVVVSMLTTYLQAVVFRVVYEKPSTEEETNIVYIYAVIQLLGMFNYMWESADARYIVPIIFILYTIKSIGVPASATGNFMVPFLAFAGMFRSTARVIFGTSQYAYYFNRVAYVVEVCALFVSFREYNWNLERDQRLPDVERLVVLGLMAVFYSGRLRKIPALRALDRTLPSISNGEFVNYFSLTDAVQRRSYAIHKLDLVQLQDVDDLPPPLEEVPPPTSSPPPPLPPKKDTSEEVD